MKIACTLNDMPVTLDIPEGEFLKFTSPVQLSQIEAAKYVGIDRKTLRGKLKPNKFGKYPVEWLRDLIFAKTEKRTVGA